MTPSKNKAGRPFDPVKREHILNALSADPHEFLEIGTPPYNVADLAERLKMDASNLRKALIQLEGDGMVVREHRKHEIWNAIAGNHVPRICVSYWNAATMRHDKALSDAYLAGSDERQKNALVNIFEQFR